MKIFTKERQLTPSLDLLPRSFRLFKQYPWHAAYLSFIPALLLSVSYVILLTTPANTTSPTLAQSLASLLFFVSITWYALAAPGFVIAQLNATRGRNLPVLECFKRGLKKFFPLMGLSLASSVVIVLGLLALVVPGLMFMRGLLLAQYYLIDTDLGIVGSMKQSYQDSKPVSAWIWGLIGVIIGISLIGSVLARLPVVGQLLSLAVVYPYIFAPALRYMEVSGKASQVPELSSELSSELSKES